MVLIFLDLILILQGYCGIKCIQSAWQGLGAKYAIIFLHQAPGTAMLLCPVSTCLSPSPWPGLLNADLNLLTQTLTFGWCPRLTSALSLESLAGWQGTVAILLSTPH